MAESARNHLARDKKARAAFDKMVESQLGMDGFRAAMEEGPGRGVAGGGKG